VKNESPIPIEKLRQWSESTPEAPALHECLEDGWVPTTWKQYYQRARQLGAALVALGHQSGECVVILSGNRAEWLYAQWGIMMAGGVVTPCYQTNPPEHVSYLVGHCGAKIAIVENADQLAKLAQIRSELEQFRQAIVIDSEGIDAIDGVSPDWVMSFEEFLALGKEQHDAVVEERFAALDRDADAFIIYTSGTTGRPKAVLISHGNLAVGGEALLKNFPAGHTRTVCYLPLCHIAEQSATNLVQLETGGEVFLCRDYTKIAKYLQEVRPNSLFGVPRIWEKVEAALKAKFAKESPRKRKLIDWARRIEMEACDEKRDSGEEPRSFKRWLAHFLVLDKVLKALGMENVDYFLTGAAPIGTDTLKFFASLGVRINEVYGLSETGGILTATVPGEVALGTVGKPILGVELKIADDGEILARGPGLSRGYLHDPEATAELWEDGWMHSGDIGEYDNRGNLRITDRKKDLIITAQAKNIAPQPIESKLMTIRGVSHAVVVGDRRKYLIALLTLDPVNAPLIAAELGIASRDPQTLAAEDAFLEYLKGEIDRVNRTLARYETIKRFEVLPVEFSIETGEMTPTMKLKRRVVIERYSDVIETVYSRPR
jgi:long-chain acyl-CoA synthetase